MLITSWLRAPNDGETDVMSLYVDKVMRNRFEIKLFNFCNKVVSQT